jgi:choline kinase
MLSLLGKTLLERQVETLRASGIHDITIVRGFQPDKITLSGVTYRENKEYASTNMLATLMAARSELVSAKEGVLVAYADIIYEKRLIESLSASSAEVNVLVDDCWLEYWQARLNDWESDIESLQYDATDRITEIGTPGCPLTHAMSRYIGLIKFSASGIAALIRAFESYKALYWDQDSPWRKSKSFKKAYMTCMLQELVDRGLDVKAVHTSHGWMEFDTVEDYEKCLQWVKDGTLNRFIRL